MHGLATKHEAIKEAALAVFVRHGYAATSLDDIATESGVSRQTVYNHFGDKEALFLTVVDEAFRATLAQLRAASEAFDEATGLVDHLVDLGNRIVAILNSRATIDLRLLIESEAPRHPALLALWQQRADTPVWSALAGHLARLAHRGLICIDDPVRAAGQFVTLVTGTGFPWAADPSPLDGRVRANVELFVRACTDGSTRGVTSQPA